ncbi:RDD family protein [Paenibacillus wulumuqiensis]|uniref:RDD family protein n=1 Tax=Paenibacillus wulumuqiensis TaxID=1567107 RepID=UPI000695C487|nr:RDD family protein [Paenibacillus wulumuqiensis]
MMNEPAAAHAANNMYDQRQYQQHPGDEWKDLHAGFWKRFLAICIDFFILILALGSIVGITILIGNLNGYFDSNQTYESATTGEQVFGALLPFVFILLRLVCPWLYFSLFEKSKYHATPGKMVLGLVAVDQYYRPLSFGRASGRYWAKWLNEFTLYIGYMMAGWTTYKQGMHDMIASTYVVDKHALQRLHEQQREYEQQLQEYNARMGTQNMNV